MPVSKVTVGSIPSIQAVKPLETIPPVGELDFIDSQSDVPVTPVQDDKLFVRDSISSAVIEPRLNFSVSDDGLALTGCRNKSGIEMGLSVDRPVVLASLDVLTRFAADDATIKESIKQNLQLAEFEDELFKADYDFLMSRMKSQNSQLLQTFQNSLTAEEASLEEKLKTLSEISVKSEEISRRLDFMRVDIGLARPEISFAQRLQESVRNVNTRFEESRPNNNSLRELLTSESSSTSIVKGIERNINTPVLSQYERDLVTKIRNGSTLYGETFSTSNGIVYSYDDLSNISKAISCCKVLSKIMAETFTKQKLPTVKNVDLPVSLRGIRTSNFVFESSDVTDDFDNGIGRRLENVDFSSNLIEDISVDRFSPDKSIKNNNFDSIISKITETGDSITRLESLKSSYENSENFFKFKQPVGFDNDACSAHDVFLTIAGLIADSFPTYSKGVTDSPPDQYELLDALVMSFGCKSKNRNSNVILNSLWRAIILSSAEDSNYIWGEDSETYDSRTESKTVTNIDGEVKTIRASSGVNQIPAGRVSQTGDVYYKPLKRRGFIPEFADDSIREFLEEASLNESLSTSPSSHKIFDASYLIDENILTTGELQQENVTRAPDSQVDENGNNTVGPGRTDLSSVERDARLPQNVNEYDYDDRSFLFHSSVTTIRSRNNTVISTITKFYDILIQKFSSNFQIEIDEKDFYIDSRKITKAAVLDLIFECISNLVVYVVNPVFTDPTAVVKEVSRTTRGSGRNSRVTEETNGSFIGRCYLLSGHESKVSFSVAGSGPRSSEYNIFESFRLLQLFKSVSSLSNGEFSSLFQSLDRNVNLIVESARESTSRELDGSDYAFIRTSIGSELTSLISGYQFDMVNLAIISSISSLIDSAVSDLILLQNKSRNLKDSLDGFTREQKDDVFKCLSVTSVTSALLKNRNRKVASTDRFENFYERNRTGLDISAARWFYRNRRREDLENSRIIFFGLPQGFANSLIRQVRETTTAIDDSGAVSSVFTTPSASPNYFEAWLTPRGIHDPTYVFDDVRLMRFHPLIHVSQNDTISDSASFDRLRLSFSIEIFSLSTRKWEKYAANASELLEEPLAGLGLRLDEGLQIIDFHILDSIQKSFVRTSSGLEISADSLGTYKKAMSASDAASVLQLMAGPSANVVPRGAMQAREFLHRNEAGLVESVPFSRLRDQSPDKTNPSDHSLLIKFLDTRAFTRESLGKEVLLPSAFERIYCGVFNPSEISEGGRSGASYGSRTGRAAAMNISQITIKAIRN